MRQPRVLIAAACIGLLAAISSPADDGRIEIGPTDTFPIVIDGPGSYILTTDLEVVEEDVDAIYIAHPWEVTLDLGGHTVRGPCAGSGNGIAAAVGPGLRNLRVHNGIVTCFRTGLALVVGTEGGNIIEKISATHNLGTGISAQNALILDCNTYGNGGDGINASFSIVRDCIASDNSDDGIAMYCGLVQGNVARLNGGDGISLSGNANQVAFCTVYANHGYGINMAANSSSNVSHSAGSSNVLGNVINCGVGNGCHHNMLP